jgi:release factor glutamine methyltransferase
MSEIAEDLPPAEVEEAYARGSAQFMGREFLTEKGTIVPREVSSIVPNAIVELVRAGALPAELRIVDQCSGSGNIACTLALMLPGAHVYSTDLMASASGLARRNVAKHGVEGRVEVHTGDLFKALDGLGLEGKIDAVACSPPFISSGKLAKDSAFLLEHEPREAFDAGPYGISIHMRLVKEALPMLRAGGWLVCECGRGQTAQVEKLLQRAKGPHGSWEDVRVLHDSGGVPRAVSARKLAAATAV